MKTPIALLAVIGTIALLSMAADKPAKPDVFDAVAAKPPRAPGSDVGRFQIIVTGQPHPMVLKLDTVTGDTWEYQSAQVENPTLKRNFTASGWSPISNSFVEELQKALTLGK